MADGQEVDPSQLPAVDPFRQQQIQSLGQAHQPAPPPPGPPPAAPPTPAYAPQQGNSIKRLLGNFFYGGGQAMMKHVGLPTDEELQQKQFQQNLQLRQTQSLEGMRQADEAYKQQQIALSQKQLEALQRNPITHQFATGMGVPELEGLMATPAEAMALAKQVASQRAGQGPMTQTPENIQQQFGLPAQLPLKQQAQAATMGATTNKTPNEVGLTVSMLKGDPQAKAALDSIQGRRLDLVKARVAGMNQRPLYVLQKVVMPDGSLGFATGLQILDAQSKGISMVPAGPLGSKDVIAVQQLKSEAGPAITNTRASISAYDNPNDRAIYARIMGGAGAPVHGQEASWMGNIVNQALQENLSEAGRNQSIALGRLAETMGRLRSTLGLPSTDSAMALTLGLLPGPGTPDSRYATQKIDQVEQMVQQAIGIPALRSAGGGGAPSATTTFFSPLTNKTYHIPANRMPEFIKAHPEAQKR